MEAWLIGLSGYIGFRIEPLTYAVVLVALGVGLWPGRLPVTRVKPPTMGVIIVLYGALALIAALFSDVGPGLLEGFPFAILFGIGVLRVLELPVETPQAGSSGGRIDATLAAIGSTSGLRTRRAAPDRRGDDPSRRMAPGMAEAAAAAVRTRRSAL